MEKNEKDQIVKRLDVLIRLMLDQQIAEKKGKRKDQLLLMDSAGLSSGEIASILGQQSKNVVTHVKEAKEEKNQKRKTMENDK